MPESEDVLLDISPDEELIEVEIGGLLTPVNKSAWEKNSEEVESTVIAARNAQRLEDAAQLADEYQDYTEIVAETGEDGEPDDEVE